MKETPRKTSRDDAIREVVLDKIARITLPRILKIKEHLDCGESLTDFQIQYLLETYERNTHNRELFHNHPEYNDFETELMALYTLVINTGLKNEDR